MTAAARHDAGAMPTYRYHRVDVFTDIAFRGNPLAVFPHAVGLDKAQMQALAREMNLSETVFVLPPSKKEAKAALRIFTIDREMPIAGHPVVGAAHVLAETGVFGELRPGRNVVLLELGIGVLPVDIEVVDGRVSTVFMTQQLPKFREPFAELDLIATALGLRRDQVEVGSLQPRVVDTGIPWFLIPLTDLHALRELKPHPLVCAELASVVGTDLFHAFTQDTGDPSCAVRTRHVWWGKATPGEDPVTGSAIGCIASYMVSEGVILASPEAVFAIEQGEEVGRPGKVVARITAHGGQITRVQVGGDAVLVGSGEIRVD
jgi:trans-2,3-dihydro-3-hydroxyanthranilate isomerase